MAAVSPSSKPCTSGKLVVSWISSHKGELAIQLRTESGATRVRKLRLDDPGKRDSLEQAGKNLDMADLDQVIDRASVRDHQPHRLESEFFESLAFLLEIFKRVLLIDPV